MDTINNIKINVKNGNVATEKADCIVVPQFDSCASYGGVGRAIEIAGMAAGLEAYDKAATQKPFKFGDVLITRSGKAGVRLAHIVTAGVCKNEQFKVVLNAIFQMLVLAKDLKIHTIAVPEVGTGIIGHLTPEQSAKAIFGAIYQFSLKYPESGIEEIAFVIYHGSTAEAEEVLSQKSYLDLKDEKGKKDFDMAEWMHEMGLK